MKLTKYAGLIVTLTGLTAPAVSGERLSTTIRVLDQADIGVSRIHKMERYVENSLAAIEIDVKWVDCATNLKVCQSKRGPNEFWLRILAQMPPRNGIAGTDTLGFTQRGEPGSDGIQCVSIFYPMVEQLSDRVAVDSHQILGAAVVHALKDKGISELAFPWSLMVTYLIAGAVVGVVASLVPAFRAARLNVLAAIAYE